MTEVRIDVGAEFTRWLGGRTGEYGGDRFRAILAGHVRAGRRVVVDLDGVEGWVFSWCEEVFGGLVREFGAEANRLVHPVATLHPWRAEDAQADMNYARFCQFAAEQQEAA